MEPAEQLYHLQLEGRKLTQQLRHETAVGFDYLRKSAEHSSRRAQQSLAATGPTAARSSGRGWASSTRELGGPAAPPESKAAAESLPQGLPAELRNILIRNQQMEARWQRDFSARLRQAGEEQPDPSRARATAEQEQQGGWRRPAEQPRQAPAPRAAAPQQDSRAQSPRKQGRGWDDSTRRFGSGYGDEQPEGRERG